MLSLKWQDQLEYVSDEIGYNCNYDFPYFHTHDFWEFVFVKYDITHSINGTTYTVPANSVLIIKPEDTHMLRAVDNPLNAKKEPTHLNIKTTPAMLEKLVSAIDPLLIERLRQRDDLFRQINIESATLFSRFLSAFTWSSDKTQNLIMAKSMALYIIMLFYETIYMPDPNSVTLPAAIEKIVTRMNSLAYLNASIADITKDANYSYMQLSRLFKKYTGFTMSDYFINIKFQSAAQALRTTDKMIIDISNDIGISSLSHFNHIFKTKFGVTPSQYRKQK